MSRSSSSPLSSSGSSVSSSSSLDLSSPEPPASPFPSSELASRLPLEIVSMIVKEATSYATDLPTGGRHAASRFCLVSKSLLPIARAGLYHTLTAEHCRDYEGDGAIGEFDPSDTSLGWSDDDRLRRTLKENPSLGGFCRTLRIEIFDSDYQENLERHPVWVRIKDLLQACPKVQALTVASDDVFAEGALDGILAELADQGWGAQLSSLAVGYTGPGSLAFLSSLRCLQHLRLLGGNENAEAWPTPSSVPFSLLSLVNDRCASSSFMETTISHSKNTLRSVTLESSLMLAQPALLPSLIVLEDLTVDLSDPSNTYDNTPSNERLREVFEMLGKCTTLKKLSFSASAMITESFRPLPLALLPSSITLLDISSSFDVTYSSVSHYLINSRHLHTLKCDRQDWSAEDKATIVALCEELGVELQGRVLTYEEEWALINPALRWK
ncbi:hypothetical protein BCR35DRAFT_353637 [Leucosporidium creatinivorum]|uniref:F-box domain-containing protein n=1 Tax=Leucosporidium creatinivorum TaxID=106004 RepID=A0A1Y2EUS6_9BASI|nr:hypothetical protein BCR35DRAFT_353637 [Leucosporidium creatinivorum]